MSDNKVTLDQLDNSAIEAMSSSVGNVSMLNTENKTIVGALAEIVGKKEIANAIGEPLAENDKFTEMSSEINGLLSTFKTNMMNAGVVVESGDKFKALIDKIKGLTEGEGNKGIQYAEGTGSFTSKSDSKYDITLNTPFGFLPTYVFIEFPTGYATMNVTQSIADNGAHYVTYSVSGGVSGYAKSFNDTSVTIYCLSTRSALIEYKWYAIGVGEEDTTLRDSLADILENKGVDVTEEDDMASLIGKVDGMSSGLDIISATELPATGKEGQICVLNNVDDTSIVLTPNYSDISNDNTNIIGITGVKSLSNDVSMILNGINYTLPLSRFYYQGKTIPSYIYQNNTWKEFTNTKSYLFKSDYLDDPVLPPMGDLDETSVDNYTHLALLTNEDGTKYMYLQPCKSNYGMEYNRIICSAEKIDFSKYNTVEIELKFVYDSSSNTNNMGFGYTVGYSDTFSSRDYDRTFQYGSTVSNSEYPSLKPNVYTTITADISKQSGEYYILFSFGISSYAVFINSICLY